MTDGKPDNEQWLDAERDDPEAFGATLAAKLQDFTGGTYGPGCNLHYKTVAIAYVHLHGFDMEGVGANASLVTRSGNQGSIAELRVPAAAGQLRKVFNIITGPQVTWSAVATTTDFGSEAQAVTARNALQYYEKHGGFDARAKEVEWESLGFAEGALHIPWDTEKGEIVAEDPDTGKPVKSGDMDFRRISTWDIIRDPALRSFDSRKWLIVREWNDRFDVAAPFKDSADPKAQEKYQACIASNSTAPVGAAWMPFKWTSQANNNQIPVYYLYCETTPSVPQGRQTRFLEDGTVLEDGPLDPAYVSEDGSCILPVVRTAAGEYAGTPWPYSKFSGVLGIGQARDGLKRDLLTNATATSGNVISCPEDQMDSGASVAFQSGGPQLIPRKPGAPNDLPVVLQLQQSHPEHFKLDQTLGNESQQILGLDQLTAGAEAAMPSSGALAALMTSTSVQNNSDEQSRWVKFKQDCGNVILRHIQKHMKVPKRIALAGKARSSLVTTTEIEGTAVQGIERVVCTIGAAMEQTDAGKYEIAKEAMEAGWVKTPEQFQEVRDTGRLDALSEDLSNELLLIRAENEALSKGEEVVVVLEDDHRLHIKRHRSVVSSLTARKDPSVVAAVAAHNDWHLRMLRETDPQLLELMGQQGMAPQMPPGGPGAPAGGPPGMPKPPQAEQQAQAPSLPTNPTTGQKQTPAAGVPPPALAIKPN